MGIVLLYHRIADVTCDPWGLSVTPAHFAEHLDVLRRMSHPISLAMLAAGTNDDPLSIALTFDDGYADNASLMCSLLEQFDTPATVFVSTGYLGCNEFWWDELCRLVCDGDSDRNWRAWHDSSTLRQATYRTAWENLRNIAHEERRRALDSLQAESSHSPEVRTRPMTHEQLYALAQCDLIEIGCHTRTHPVLSSLSVDAQNDEILGSRRDLEAVTGKAPTSFAYPYGHRLDYTPGTVELVRTAGFRLACANEPGAVHANTPPLELPRIHVDDMDGDTFARQLSDWLDRRW